MFRYCFREKLLWNVGKVVWFQTFLKTHSENTWNVARPENFRRQCAVLDLLKISTNSLSDRQHERLIWLGWNFPESISSDITQLYVKRDLLIQGLQNRQLKYRGELLLMLSTVMSEVDSCVTQDVKNDILVLFPDMNWNLLEDLKGTPLCPWALEKAEERRVLTLRTRLSGWYTG